MSEEKKERPTTNTPAPRRAPSGRPFRRSPGFRRKVCKMCAEKMDTVDYKDSAFLRNFTMDSGKILSRRITGTCAKHQRQICKAIKISRNMAIMPYSSR
jgi:small subunit ribosomal protein S18